MDLSPELFDQIDAYIHNRMTAEERTRFGQRLREDDALRQEVELQQRLDRGLDTVLVRRQFAGVRFERQQERRQQQRTYAVAASVALLLICSVAVLVSQLTKPAHEVAFATYYQPEPIRRADEPAATALSAAQADYYAGRYEQALAQVKKIPDDSLFRTAYYRGLTQLALDQTTDAQRSLQQARQSADMTVRYRAEWYLSLTLLRAGNTEQAVAVLRQIAANPGQPYREQATQILRDLQ